MVSPMATYPPLSLRDISPNGEHPSVKPYGLPAPLSVEPINKIYTYKTSPFKERWHSVAVTERFLNPSAIADTTIPHS